MSSSSISAQSFDVEEVGKTFKSSKKRFTWKVQMDKTTHTIQLFASFISGKRKIVHNGNIVYEGKKGVGKDFSFPFNIGKNLVFIYALGEGYSMKINNIEFTQLQSNHSSSSSYSNTSTSKYVEPSFKGYDNYETYNKPRSQTGYDAPKPKSAWDDVKKASNQARSSVSGASTGYTEKPSSKYSGDDNYVEKAGTKYSQNTAYTSSNPVKKQEEEEPSDFLDLASHFTKFDYKDGGNQSTNNTQTTKSKSQPTSNLSVNSKPSFTSNEPSPFESHQNTFTKPSQSVQPKTQTVQQKQEDRKENKMDFGNFGDFGGPSKSENVKKTAFDGFGGFDNFSNSQPTNKPTVQSTQSTQQTQSKTVSNQDLFGLDFSNPQPVQNRTSNPNPNVFDTNSEPTKLYGYDGYDSVYQPNKNTNQTGYSNQNSKITSNDLFGLDMSQTPQQNNNFNQYQQQSYQQPSYQQPSYQQPQQQKKSGWNSDLMTLDLNGLDSAKNMGTNSYSNPQPNQNTGYGGGYNAFGNLSQGSNPFETNNMTGYSNQNQGGGGGYPGLFDGSSNSTYGGNFGNNNYGGNNFGGNQGFGGNQYGGNTNQNSFNQFGGGGFQNNQVPVTTNKMATPFDDDF